MGRTSLGWRWRDGKHGPERLLCFPWERLRRAGKECRIAHWNNVGGLSAILRSLDVCYLALDCFRSGKDQLGMLELEKGQG